MYFPWYSVTSFTGSTEDKQSETLLYLTVTTLHVFYVFFNDVVMRALIKIKLIKFCWVGWMLRLSLGPPPGEEGVGGG